MSQSGTPKTMRLERFTDVFPYNIAQGSQIASLVRRQGPWLQEYLPGTAERYRSAIVAAKSVLRLAQVPNLKMFAVYEKKTVIGVAAVCLGQIAIHPERPAQPITFHDHDYWLSEEYTERQQVHAATAAMLTSRTRYPLPLKEGTPALRMHYPVVPIVEGMPNPPFGYEEQGYVRLEEKPVTLAVPEGMEDTLSVARNGAPLHLYVHPEDSERFYAN